MHIYTDVCVYTFMYTSIHTLPPFRHQSHICFRSLACAYIHVSIHMPHTKRCTYIQTCVYIHIFTHLSIHRPLSVLNLHPALVPLHAHIYMCPYICRIIRVVHIYRRMCIYIYLHIYLCIAPFQFSIATLLSFPRMRIYTCVHAYAT